MNENPSIAEALAHGVDLLAATGDSPRLDAELLLARALDVPRSYLMAHPEDTLDPAATARYSDSLTRRRQGQPIAYITGEKEFWSMVLMVSPATLVPRPETEHLVEHAIGCLPRHCEHRVLDLGTGSGAVALAIARERPLCRVVATDLSSAVLDIARENARQHDLPNVEFVAGDWTAPVRGRRFDVIVSNPPYVAEGDPALAELSFEPAQALVAGEDGLDAIHRIAAEALDVVETGGVLLVEHGAGQAGDVAAILEQAGWQEVRSIRDLAGRPRVTFARAPESG